MRPFIYNSLLNNVLNSEERIVAFPGGSVVKNRPANSGDVSSTSLSGENPLEKDMDRGAQLATVHGVSKSPMTEQLSTRRGL